MHSLAKDVAFLMTAVAFLACSDSTPRRGTDTPSHLPSLRDSASQADSPLGNEAGGASEAAASEAGSGEAGISPRRLAYWQDIVPIVENKCMGCLGRRPRARDLHFVPAAHRRSMAACSVDADDRASSPWFKPA